MPVAVSNVLPKKSATSCQSQTDTSTSKNLDKRPGKVPTKSNNAVTAQNKKPVPAPSWAASNRARKGTNDPVGQFKRYGALDDHGADDDDGEEDMDYHLIRSKSSSPKKEAK